MQDERKKLTAVIIVKNGASQIANCLESIKWVDEVVVMDGFSTDGTVEICKEYGANVYQHKFEGFDTERNLGAEHATGDWVLQLDADEIVTEGMRHAVEEVLRDDKGHSAYKFRRRNFFFGRPMKHGGWYHYSAHFFKKGHAVYKGKIHETLTVDGTQGTIEADVDHHPFTSISQFVKRQNRYTTLQAQRIYDEKGEVSEKEVRYNISRKPIKLFWKLYIKKKGYKEGSVGLVFSILNAWVHFLKWAKYWEMVIKK